MVAKKKVHIGCGAVYLIGYDNLDVPSDEFFFASERPDIVKTNSATVEKYYKDKYYNNFYQRFLLKKSGARKIPPPKGLPAKTLKRRQVVIDEIAYANHLPYKKNSLDEIRCVQVFEHFTPKEAVEVLIQWKYLLKNGGKISIDLPDIIETSQLLAMAETVEERSWAEKLIYGTRNDNFAYHKAGYWPEKLADILSRAGFRNIKQGPNIHQYPAFSMEAKK